MSVYPHRFDFDVGHLIKSPCKRCFYRDALPDCMESCLVLDRIRTVLANSVSCSKSISSFEPYAVFDAVSETE